MRGFVIVLLTATLVAACGRAPQTGPAAGDRLYEAVSTPSGPLVDIIDSRSHAVLGVLPLGTPSAGWQHYYAVRGGILEDIDPHSGETLHMLGLSRPYDVPAVAVGGGLWGGLSQNGKWLALETQRSAGESHLLVVDTSFIRPPVAVDLSGSFGFDGISNDGERLYLLQYLSANDYKVRFYNVVGGFLDPTVVVDKLDPTEPMTGERLATVDSSDGQWQFTVYARARKGAFVHALQMAGTFSLCLELPGSGWESDPSVYRWSLAASPDGSRVYATNGALGLVVELDARSTSAPAILRTQSIPKDPLQAPVKVGSGGAVVSRDGTSLAMAGGAGVEWIDTSTMRPTAHALPSWVVWGLGLSPDGRSVYAVKDSGQIAELSPEGAVLSMFDPHVGHAMALMRVEAAT